MSTKILKPMGVSNPNLLINGDFQVWQRGESFTFIGKEEYVYTADRWCVYGATGQSIKVDKVAGGLQISGTKQIIQRFEKPLKTGIYYMLSAKINGAIRSLLITGSNYTSNDFLRYQKAGAYEEIDVFISGTTTIEYVKLEVGALQTKFSPRLMADEMAMCLRYYECIDNLICQQYYMNQYIGFNFYPKRSVPTIRLKALSTQNGSTVQISNYLETSNNSIRRIIAQDIYQLGNIIYTDIFLDAEIY